MISNLRVEFVKRHLVSNKPTTLVHFTTRSASFDASSAFL